MELDNLDKEISQNALRIGAESLATATEISNQLLLLLAETLSIRSEGAAARKAQQNLTGEVPFRELLDNIRLNKNTMENVVVADEDISELKAELDKLGLVYNLSSFKKDDAHLLSFSNTDRMKVEEAIKSLAIKKGLISEVSHDVFLNEVAGEDILIIKNLSEPIEALLKKEIKESGIFHSSYATPQEKGFLLKSEDFDKVNDLIAKVSWALSGKRRDEILTNLEILKINSLNIQNAPKLNKDGYVVSATNPKTYLKINREGFAYYKNGKNVFEIKREDPLYHESYQAKIQCINSPIYVRDLNREELRETEEAFKIYPFTYSLRDEMFEKQAAMELVKERYSVNEVGLIKEESLKEDKNKEPLAYEKGSKVETLVLASKLFAEIKQGIHAAPVKSGSLELVIKSASRGVPQPSAPKSKMSILR